MEDETIVRVGLVKKTDDPLRVVILSPCVGWYYFSSADSFKPYVQMGQYVKAGFILCRIRTLSWAGVGTKIRRRPTIRDYVITSPISGILTERLAADAQIIEQPVEGMGSQKFLTVTDGFAVQYGEPLFALSEDI